MPQLNNKKRELFARYLSSGTMTQAEAYSAAGYTPSSSNASILANTDEVKARIAELVREEEQKKLDMRLRMAEAGLDPDAPEGLDVQRAWTADRVRDMLSQNAQLSQSCGDFKNARDSIELIGKSLHMFDKDTKESGGNGSRPEVSLTLINQAAGAGEGSTGPRLVEGPNPLAPRLSDTADA